MENSRVFTDCFDGLASPITIGDLPDRSAASGAYRVGRDWLMNSDHLGQFRNFKPVEIGILDDFAPNAIVGQNNDTFCIALTRGLPDLISDLTLFLWVKDGFLPDIPSLESSVDLFDTVSLGEFGDAKNYELYLPYLSAYWHAQSTDFRERMGRLPLKNSKSLQLNALLLGISDQRTQALFHTFISACNFVWHHELGHAVDGHSDFLREHSDGEQYLFEAPHESTTNNVGSRLRELMELRADAFAADQVFCRHIYHELKDNSLPYAGLSLEVAGEDRLLITALGLFVCAFAMSMVGHEMSIDSDYRTHPPGSVRLGHMTIIFQLSFERVRPMVGNDAALDDLRGKFWNRLSGCVAKLAGLHPDGPEWMSSITPEGGKIAQAYINQLLADLGQTSTWQPDWQSGLTT